LDAINKSLKIAILRTSSIGDVVLATSCLSLLKEVTPNAKIVWLGKSPSLSVIRDAFPSVECIEIDKNLKIYEILKRLSDVDFFLDLQVNLRSRIISHAFKNRFRRPIFSCSKSQLHRNRLVLESRIYGRRRELPLRAMESLKPQFVQMTDALLYALEITKCLPKKFTARKESLIPNLPVNHYEDKKDLFSTITGKRWIAVSPGASYETKQAPLSLFSESLEKLQYSLQKENFQEPLGLIFLGDKKDAEICQFLIQALNWSGPVLNFSGRLTLWENAVILNKTLYLLSNDSSLGHIAEAVGTPALVLFGPTVEGFGFAPHKKESRAYSSRLGCRPCSKHGKSPCRFGDKLCFLQIPQGDLVQYMKELVMGGTLTFTKNLI
jgi:ADP-heptose:LPS heptosyltransferase